MDQTSPAPNPAPGPDDLDRRLAFLAEAAKLRQVERAGRVPGADGALRRENSAEHSWHLTLHALALADQAGPEVSLDRVIRMLILHDLVEIDAGDTPFHAARPADMEAKEDAAAERLFGMLPAPQGADFLALWREFEAAESPDARFAKALDRLQPVLLNLESGGGTWPDFQVTEQQVLDRCGPPIEGGAPRLWPRIKSLVQKHFASLRG